MLGGIRPDAHLSNRLASGSPVGVEVAVERGPRDTHSPAHLGDGHIPVPHQAGGEGYLPLVHHPLPAALLPPGPRRLKPRHRPLADDVALEPRQGCEHVEDELAGRNVVASRLSRSERNPTPLSCSSPISSRSSFSRERPSLSSFQTTNTSPSLQYSRARLSSAPLSFLEEILSSKILSQPAASSSVRCIWGF